MRFRSIDAFIFSSSDFCIWWRTRMDKSEQRILIKHFSMKDLGSRLIHSELKSVLYDSAYNLSIWKNRSADSKLVLPHAQTIQGLADSPPTCARLSEPSFWSFLSSAPAKCQGISEPLIIFSRQFSAASSVWGSSRDAGSCLGPQTIKKPPGLGT
jgi:hypothetical protein